MSKETTTESIIERLKKEPLFTVVNDVLAKAGEQYDSQLESLVKHASTEGLKNEIRSGLDAAVAGLEAAKRAASGPAMENLAKAILHTAHTVSKHVPLRFHDKGRETPTPIRSRGPGDIPLQGGKGKARKARSGKHGAVKEFVAKWRKANPKGKGGELKQAARKAGLNPASAAVAFYKKS